ncbi:hypothetical protein [Promicromonospora kroppenstedtii]|uniref:hypothetical protein n=1 Tax=Promicromonospora kroppenstedtii TaxID=440482 RepID=UPI000560FF9C|nr:hypothetical protein [Promicromonospora kroppenstedtii]
MKEQNDTLVSLIHDVADQVGPVAGIDGETMARRAIRHERTRRGVIGGVVTLAVAALVTVGGMMATGKQVLPAGWPFGDGWHEVSGGGLILSVPSDFEAYDQGEGYPSWGTDGQEGPFDPAEVTAAVTVMPLDEGDSPSESDSDLVEIDVPGAASAQYLLVEEGWDAGPQGMLEVELESGRVVQVIVVLPDAPESASLFERLVEGVRVDPDATEADLDIQGPALDVIEEHPADWAVQEHQGLSFAIPGDWVEDDLSAAREGNWPTVSMDDADGELRLQVTTSGASLVPDDEFGHTYEMALPPGADRAGAELDPQDGTLHAFIEVRRAEGRTYTIDVYVPEGADGDRVVSTIAGSLEFTAEAEDLPSYEDLPDGRALVDAAPPVPEDWVVVSDLPDVRLRVPADWTSLGEDGELVREAPGDEYEGVGVSVEEAGILGNGDIPVGGYRIDVPGAEQATVRMTDYTAYGEEEAAAFNARVEVELPDGRFVQLGYDGPPGSDDRFWQMLGTLEVVTD